METLFHIADRAALNLSGATRSYRAPSMDTEGFIHCCTATQLSGVVNRYYSNVTNLLLLQIDTTKLLESPVMENTVGGDELFPHLYQELPLSAVSGKTVFNAVDVGSLNVPIGSVVE